MGKIKVGIIGPGNIGTDLMEKIKKSSRLELDTMIGIDPNSEGLKRAKKEGYNITSNGLEDVVYKNENIDIYFDATSAKAHKYHAPILRDANKIAIDLTPAAVGPYVCPVVNMKEFKDEINVNLITCGGQATIPIVYAINTITNVDYAEVVATISSSSAGPGTRNSIDEFTQTTSKGLEVVGGADKAKAIILLNPAEPPIMMRNTIYTKIKDSNKIDEIYKKAHEMKEEVQKYVPGYDITLGPIIEGDKVTTMTEVQGAGDYLPEYAGNLDIETSAAVRIGEFFAKKLLKGER